jgi:hypothetical protein
MKRIGRIFLCSFLLLWVTPASAQTTLDRRVDELFHEGWYFRGSTRADAEARISGINRTSLVVDCKGSAPRVMVFFRDAMMPLNAVTTTSPVKVTFDFLKRGVTSWITSYFDKESVRRVFGEHIASGTRGMPATVEHVNFIGTDASTILSQLKSMDSVSVDADELGQPVTFDLHGAAPMIDHVLAICSSGPD